MLTAHSKIPKATVCQYNGEEIVEYDIRDFLGEGLNILIGLPGVYTPICTYQHIPSLIEQSSTLKARKVQNIICISNDNPWAIYHWAKSIPESDSIEFICDGNSEFLEAIKMSGTESNLFLKGKYARFYAIVKDGHIQKVRFEKSVLETVCTSGACILSDLDDLLHSEL